MTGRQVVLGALAGGLLAGAAGAAPLTTRTLGFYGTPGLLEMPTAEAAPDAELWSSFSAFGQTGRVTLGFQLAPRLTGTFRYSRIRGYEPWGGDRYDRSFDLRYQLIEQDGWWPAVALGLQDFVGTGLYGAEYLVATRSLDPEGRLRATLGLGWGRLGERDPLFATGTRDPSYVETGGTANADDWFRGDAALFGGLSWQVRDGLTLMAEYGSDMYRDEAGRGLIDIRSPWNLGADLALGQGVRLSAGYLYGSEAAVTLSFALNPTARDTGPGAEPAGLPIGPRPGGSEASADQRALAARLAAGLAAEGITLEAVHIGATTAELRIENRRWGAQAQALGRAARVAMAVLPAPVEELRFVLMQTGVAMTTVTWARRDLEAAAHAPGSVAMAQARIGGAPGPLPADALRLARYPQFDWSMGPYVQVSYFDPDNPLRADFGAKLLADLTLAPGLVLGAHVTQPIFGNLDEITRGSNSVLPRVRSDFARYLDQRGPALQRLDLAWYTRPGEDLYARMTAGYLERMYAGLSAELLWKRPESLLSYGIEMNYARQREFDDAFALRDYDVVTGHASAYLDLPEGYSAQLDVGRYLAGDTGATLSLDRSFANGWRVGAYATLTDVPFEDFGEGSFDKGLRLTIPLDWLTGRPSTTALSSTIQPLTRDGGARLGVAGRLHDRVRTSHGPWLDARSGRFWK